MGTVPADNLTQAHMVSLKLALSFCILFIIGLEALPKPKPEPKPWGYEAPNRHHYSVCQEPMTTAGLCRARMPAWTFNRLTGQCEYIIYGGCGGTGNLLRSKRECYEMCQKIHYPHIYANREHPANRAPCCRCGWGSDTPICMYSCCKQE